MNPSYRWSLFGRAMVAVLLTIGFYGLALGIAFGLLWLVYAEVVLVGRINLRLTLFAIAGAFVILWAIFPRIDRFEPPGPRLSSKKFPALFHEIEKIARATKQSMPRDVYLLADVNAFVTERGGLMGIGSRRVMGIGLPLFSLMTVDELRSVLAHEFGHFYGGDTALGPWIYKTRAAIIRTVMGVAQTSNILRIPFDAYAKLFLRVTNKISRQQEYTADQLAAQVVSPQSAISGLQKVHRYGTAFQVFFQQEYLPILNAGFRAPLLPGFERFLNAPRISDLVSKAYEEQVNNNQSDPYDSHPTLKERVTALEKFPPVGLFDDRPASTLLQETGVLEGQLLVAIATDKEKAKSLKEVDWEEIIERVFIPRWEKTVETFSSLLTTLTPAQLMEIVETEFDFFSKIASAGRMLPAGVTPHQVDADNRKGIISNVIGSALIVALRRHGWKVETSPGEDVIVVREGRRFEPFAVYLKLAKKELSADEWKKMCSDYGISDFNLG